MYVCQTMLIHSVYVMRYLIVNIEQQELTESLVPRLNVEIGKNKVMKQ